MIGNRGEIARLQSDFYRDQLRRVTRWLMIASVLMVLLVVAILYFVIAQPVQKYYGNTIEGRILRMPPPAT